MPGPHSGLYIVFWKCDQLIVCKRKESCRLEAPLVNMVRAGFAAPWSRWCMARCVHFIAGSSTSARQVDETGSSSVYPAQRLQGVSSSKPSRCIQLKDFKVYPAQRLPGVSSSKPSRCIQLKAFKVYPAQRLQGVTSSKTSRCIQLKDFKV
eukprot:366291-Chlamydomonas_euryale.AAC.3